MLEESTNRSGVRMGQQLDGYREALWTHRTSTGLHVLEVRGVQHAGCSKRPFSKAAGEREPEAQHFSPAHPKLPRQLVLQMGYVEHSCEPRTKLEEKRVSARGGLAGKKGDFFSILIAGWLVVLCLLAGAGCAAGHARLDHLAWDQSRLIDLTHSFGADTIVWPTEQDFRLVHQQAGDTSGGYYYASNRLEMAEHGGTHIDAPIHFSKGGQTLDQVPIGRLVGAGVRIDVAAQCARDRDYLVTIKEGDKDVVYTPVPNP